MRKPAANGMKITCSHFPWKTTPWKERAHDFSVRKPGSAYLSDFWTVDDTCEF